MFIIAILPLTSTEKLIILKTRCVFSDDKINSYNQTLFQSYIFSDFPVLALISS